MRSLVKLAVGVLLLCVPTSVYAQAAISGVVKDPSGAVLPGVTVEAASPVLIEKVRTGVTDDRGVYRIVNLLPGTYTVTFSLQGFNVVRREGIELSGQFNAQIDAALTVGGVAETITVSSETPIVDVQSIRRQTTISSEVLTSIPTAPVVGRHRAPHSRHRHDRRRADRRAGDAADDRVRRRGGRSNEGRMQVDG
jgi:hypothetical protein